MSVLQAYACAICFGNPDSLQTKGALAGVFFLMSVVFTVIAAMAATAIVWARRASQTQKKSGA